MARRAGGYLGAKPTWTTTSTSGIFSMDDVVELMAAGTWPRGPVAPTNLTATAGNGQVALSWTAPATTHGTLTDYVVQYSSDSGSTWTTFSDGTSTSTSATVTGLTNGTAYVFRVAAVNGVGTGAYSTASSAVTPTAQTNYNFVAASNPTHPASGLYVYDGVSNGKPYWARYSGGTPNAYIYWSTDPNGSGWWIVGPSLGSSSSSNRWYYKFSEAGTPPVASDWEGQVYGGFGNLSVAQ